MTTGATENSLHSRLYYANSPCQFAYPWGETPVSSQSIPLYSTGGGVVGGVIDGCIISHV